MTLSWTSSVVLPLQPMQLWHRMQKMAEIVNLLWYSCRNQLKAKDFQLYATLAKNASAGRAIWQKRPWRKKEQPFVQWKSSKKSMEHLWGSFMQNGLTPQKLLLLKRKWRTIWILVSVSSNWTRPTWRPSTTPPRSTTSRCSRRWRAISSPTARTWTCCSAACWSGACPCRCPTAPSRWKAAPSTLTTMAT